VEKFLFYRYKVSIKAIHKSIAFHVMRKLG